MDNNMVLDKMENIFIDVGFIPVMLNGVKFFKFEECYCKITFISDWSAFVIESADNIRDAEKGVLEDGDLYYTDVSEKELLVQFRSDLIQYYMS